MRGIVLRKLLSLSAAVALILAFSGQAHSESVTLNLTQNSLKNVDDAAGRWQHEGGSVSLGDIAIGNYAISRRITTGGTDAQNTAMLTMTIFVTGQNPPQNLTLQGSHDFDNGGYAGSVSAASSDLAVLIGATFSGSTATDTLTITW